MTEQTLTTLYHFDQTCGCAVELRQKFEFDENGHAPNPPLEREIIKWYNRCDFHKNIGGLDAFDRIVDDCRLVSSIEQSFIDNTDEEDKTSETNEDGSITERLKNDISIIFTTDKVTVVVPPELSKLEESLSKHEGVEYVWQK